MILLVSSWHSESADSMEYSPAVCGSLGVESEAETDSLAGPTGGTRCSSVSRSGVGGGSELRAIASEDEDGSLLSS